MNISTVNELIQSLESAGELSIKERKYLELAKAYLDVAAENVALKAVFSQGEIPDEAVDAFSDTVAIDSDWDEAEVIRAVLDAIKPETPATDRIVAGIKADGAEACVRALVTSDDDFSDAPNICAMVAYQLREGADK